MGNYKLLLTVLALLFFKTLTSSEPFFGVATNQNPVTYTTILSIEKQMGELPQIVLFYRPWPKKGTPLEFPSDSFDTIWKSGAVPCLSWEPRHSANEPLHFLDVLRGDYDDYIRGMAQAIKNFEKPMIVRFAHEMNLKVYHWGVEENQYNAKAPEVYIKLFQYVVDLFRKEGALNAFFAFCPNNIPDIQDDWNAIGHYYPGDNYVDILGIDVYDFNTSEETPVKDFKTELFPAYQTLKEINPDLPIFIFETGAAAHKYQWLLAAIDTAHELGIQGIIWFQVNKDRDWLLLNKELKQITGLDFKPYAAQEWMEQLFSKKVSIVPLNR